MREMVYAIGRGIGQVMFQGTMVWGGMLFLLAILVNSPRQAAFSAVLPVWLQAVG